MNSENLVTISSATALNLVDVCAVAAGAKVSVEPASLELLNNRRKEIVEFISNQRQPAYGFNRGYGHNVDKAVEHEGLKKLQLDLIRSHSSGVGDFADKQIVRAILLLRAKSLLLGYSGVRAEVVNHLVAFLNADLIPAVPMFGSVGASGDLAPLAHIALALIGEGEVFVGGSEKPVAASEALKQAKIAPLALEMKEGLGLINGLQFSTAIGILAHKRASEILQSACVATAISTQVLLGSDTPFEEAVHELRPYAGCVTVAGWLRSMCKDSPLRQSHKEFEIDGEVQDPYNIRCAPQIIGAALDLLNDAARSFEIEINSVTDNPLVLQDPSTKKYTRVVSAGHFHGMPVATRLYGILQALSIVSTLSNVRAARFVDESRNHGLPGDLMWPNLSTLAKSTSSGMMVAEYVSAGLTNYIWGASFPSHLLSIPTDAGQEDHVSMSAGLAVRLWQTLPRAAEVIAIELAFGAQAAAIRREMQTIPTKTSVPSDILKQAKKEIVSLLEKDVGTDYEIDLQIRKNYKISPEKRILSPICESILSKIYKVFPAVKSDRSLSKELKQLAQLVLLGEFKCS